MPPSPSKNLLNVQNEGVLNNVKKYLQDQKSGISLKLKVALGRELQNSSPRPTHTFATEIAEMEKKARIEDEKTRTVLLAATLTEQPIKVSNTRQSYHRRENESSLIVGQILSTFLGDLIDQMCSNSEKSCGLDNDILSVHQSPPKIALGFEPPLDYLGFSAPKEAPFGYHGPSEVSYDRHVSSEVSHGHPVPNEAHFSAHDPSEAPLGQIPTAFVLLREPVAGGESQTWDDRIIFPMEHEVICETTFQQVDA